MKPNWSNISDAVFHYAAINPDRVAVTDGRHTIRYQTLAQLVGQAAMYLKNLGLKQGVPVGVVLRNHVEHVVLSLAIFRIGAVLVELPVDISAAEFAARITRFNILASFVEPDGPSSPAPIGIRIGAGWLDDLGALSGDARADATADELRLIVVSSGSTGTPKGIITTQAQRMARSMTHQRLFADFWTVVDPGNLLLIEPPSLAFFAQFLTNQLLLGGTIVLLPKFSLAVEVTAAIAAWRDAICPILPGTARSFIYCATRPEILLPHVRALISAGMPLAGHEKAVLLERVSPQVHELYGSAGFGSFSHLTPADAASHPNSCGRAVTGPGLEIELVDDNDKRVGPSQEGRLRCRGGNMSTGFFNPEDNQRGAEMFADGWYYPGDVLLRDEEGYFYMRGRSDDAFVAGDLMVYPSEIEDIITRHPEIAEAVVVGRPAASGGIELGAFLVVRNSLAHEAVVAHCTAHLPEMKRPRFVLYVEQLPRTGNGKIDRPALKQAAINLMVQR
ncbi:MAG: class I adenylate-forming enzyme family protein [Acidocella sp.]|nr:class I adenylate-forming enzyme family protein [Acidocella sp.]